MPKIIKNLDKKILETALTLMADHDYDDIDMRMVAKKSDIAVGTLYNYFASKKLLFSSAVAQSWTDTLKTLHLIKTSEDQDVVKLKKYITELTYSFDERKGVGRRLYFQGIFNENRESKDIDMDIDKSTHPKALAIKESKDAMIVDLINLMALVDDHQATTDYERLATLVFLATTSFVSEFPKDKINNNNFIIDMVMASLNINS